MTGATPKKTSLFLILGAMGFTLLYASAATAQTKAEESGKGKSESVSTTDGESTAPGKDAAPADTAADGKTKETESKPATDDGSATAPVEPVPAGESAPTGETAAAAPAGDAPVKTVTIQEAAAPAQPSASPAGALKPKPVPKPKRVRHLFIISYDMAVAVGATWEFVGKFSPRGMNFDYRYQLTPQIGLGGIIGWNKFEIKERDTYVYGNATVTGTQIRRLDALQIAAAFNYNFLPIEKKVVPFLGLNMGAYSLWRATNYGWSATSESTWHFGFAPDLGVAIKLAKLRFVLGTKFHWAIATEYDGARWVTFNIGLAIPGF